MARSLEGKLFLTHINNGVMALVREDVFLQCKKAYDIRLALEDSPQFPARASISGSLSHLMTPVFSFGNENRVKRSPWLTGTHELYDAVCRHIELQGGIVRSTPAVWVPFSNGSERGLHGADAQADELRFVTTDEQFLNTFGITPQQLLADSRAGKI